jgi:hypothetical protein
MNYDDITTIDLSEVNPIDFSFNESNMNIAMQASSISGPYTTTSPGTITLGSGITIATTGLAAGAGSYTISSPYDDMETRLARLEKIIAEEDEVRKNHPAVQMAYDEYRLLYILAKKNPGDYLTNE